MRQSFEFALRLTAMASIVIGVVCLSSSIFSVGASVLGEQSAQAETGGSATSILPQPVNEKKCVPATMINVNGETCNRDCHASACPAANGACVVYVNGGCQVGTSTCTARTVSVTLWISNCESTPCATAGEFRCAFVARPGACGDQTYTTCTP